MNVGITAVATVFEYSRSKGAARLVLLSLAKHVNEQKLEAFGEATAWPSQNTLARLGNCSRSTVQRALSELVDLGEIEDTGERRTRDTVVWEIQLQDMEMRHNLTQDRSGDDDMTQHGSCGRSGSDDLTHPAHDLTDFGIDLTDPGSAPDSTLNHKQVVEVEVKKEMNKSSPPPADLDVRLSLTENGNSNSNGNLDADELKRQELGFRTRAAEKQELEERRDDCKELIETRPEGMPGHNLLAANLETVEAELAALAVLDGAEVAGWCGDE